METQRISEVMQQTGLSKELIHHYLRQGLVPRSDARARYTAQQVRLLRQIRILREDHNLPLEIIRRIFTIFDFAPERIEPLVLSESLCKRVTRLADGDLTSQTTYDEAALARATNISSDQLAEFARAGIITPLGGNGGARYSAYDAHVLALCQCGMDLGIPFESFRTVASHIRLAFALEHAEFFAIQPEALDAGQVFAGLFLRGELVGNFVVNMLGALMESQLREGLGQPAARKLAVDEIVYQPSAAFVRRHRLDERIDAARKQCATTGDPNTWLNAARLLLHAGRYTEAVFFLEQSHKRWPDSNAVRAAYGRALVLAGDNERGAAELARILAHDYADPLAAIYIALGQFERAQAAEQPEALVHEGVGIIQRVEHALAEAADASLAVRLEAQIIGGWLLSAMPKLLGCYDRGRQLLLGVVRELEDDPELLAADLPGLRDRYRVNAAFLLFHCMAADETPEAAAPSHPDEPSLEWLRTIVCSLDPASGFALDVFLEARDHNTTGGERP